MRELPMSSLVDKMRREAVAKLEAMGFIYVDGWRSPANQNQIITGPGYYSTSSPRLIAEVTTQSNNGVFGGHFSTFQDYCLGEEWRAAVWQPDGKCLAAPSAAEVLLLQITGPCDLADLPQP